MSNMFFQFIFLSISLIPFSHSQFNSPQNIETFYPFLVPSPSPSTNFPNNPPFISPPPPPISQPLPTQPVPSKSSSKKKIATVVAATAAATLFLSFVLFFLTKKFAVGSQKREQDVTNSSTQRSQTRVPSSQNGFARDNDDGDLKELSIVDEDGLDVIYWRKLEKRKSKKSSGKERFHSMKIEEQEDKRRGSTKRDEQRKIESLQDIPLLRGKSSTSHVKVVAEIESPEPISPQKLPPPPPPPIPSEIHGICLPITQNPESSQSFMTLANNQVPLPPPPPIPQKKNPAAPLPPPKVASSESSSKVLRVPDVTTNDQVKMKPLHWDKVNTTNADHSMAWDKIDGGSFRFDGDIMEALFGVVAANRKSPRRNGNSTNLNFPDSSSSQAKNFILDSRKSQNIAIIVKSLTVSCEEIINAIMNGRGIDIENLEKLSRITPTQDEQSQILDYNKDPSKLADAESFLFPLLKSVPTVFSRIKAMHFKSSYNSEIIHLKESLQTLESACKELRKHRLLMKLLEAILKAGNRMNSGTTRGNAQAFNLTALRKLSDVKSTDGKTTLLRFVVEEVTQSEGKKCALSRNNNLNSENAMSKDERVKDYMMLGLPIVGSLSADFSNVKKAATIDCDNFFGAFSGLSTHMSDIRQLVFRCDDANGGYVREMRAFLQGAEDELKVVREEEIRVLELVKQTTEYYQAGGFSKNKGVNPLQLFVIVKDFLGMVDQTCVEIARNLHRRKTSTGGTDSVSPRSSRSKPTLRFPNLPVHFMSESSSSSSESHNYP